jgi:hypothetical protein
MPDGCRNTTDTGVPGPSTAIDERLNHCKQKASSIAGHRASLVKAPAGAPRWGGNAMRSSAWRHFDEGLRRTANHMNPNPDYDASDELEYGIAAFAWLLRGVYPPPAYAPDLGNSG